MDISKLPEMRSMVTNTATMRTIDCWSRMFLKLSVLMKLGVVTASSTNKAMVSHTMP